MQYDSYLIKHVKLMSSLSGRLSPVLQLHTPNAIHWSPLFPWAALGCSFVLVPNYLMYPSTFKGPDRVLSVPAVLAGLPSLHRDAAGEASASVVRASQPRSGPKALSGPGAVGAVPGPVHREKLLRQQHHQGEVVETPSTCSWTQRQQGNAASTDGFQQFEFNLK